MRALLVFASCAGLAVCATVAASGGAQGSPGSTGARLAVDWYADTDVVGFHVDVARMPCGGRSGPPSSTISTNFEVGNESPRGPLAVVRQTADRATRHAGADLFVDLDPGCYEVLAVPARRVTGEAWEASVDCARAGSGTIRVRSGRPAVASILPQCVGDRFGRRDVLALLNRPPTVALEAPEVSGEEGETVRACATASDPDDDPLAFAFVSASPDAPLSVTVGEPTVVGFADGRRLWRACADLVGAAAASYEVRAEVHDLGWSLGRMVRLEDLVAPAESHATVTFPVHVACGETRCS